MKEPVDNKVINRIKQVFDEFEDPTAAAGWMELRKKYPERNRRPLILWLSSAAAILMLATGWWFINLYEQTGLKETDKKERIFVEKKENPSINTQEKETADNLSGKLQVTRPNQKSTYVKIPDKPLPSVSKPFISENSTDPILPITPGKPISEELIALKLPEDIQKSKASEIQITPVDIAFIKIDPVKKQANSSTLKSDEIFSSDKNENKKDNKSRKLALTVFAGSYFNYSEGSENQLNFGAGFLSDIRISKNLKLSTGMSLASNSLSYKQGIPQAASEYLNASKPQLSSGNLTSITSYNASLLALDIPVNLKFQFVPESDKVYVVAGLSSGTYLNETYNYQYRFFNPASGSYSSQSQDQELRKQLNDFDLGRTLNLSFGLSTGFGKTQTISIEPFLKYPLGGLGSENLRFGSTGINLKLHFKPAKK